MNFSKPFSLTKLYKSNISNSGLCFLHSVIFHSEWVLQLVCKKWSFLTEKLLYNISMLVLLVCFHIMYLLQAIFLFKFQNDFWTKFWLGWITQLLKTQNKDIKQRIIDIPHLICVCIKKRTPIWFLSAVKTKNFLSI